MTDKTKLEAVRHKLTKRGLRLEKCRARSYRTGGADFGRYRVVDVARNLVVDGDFGTSR